MSNSLALLGGSPAVTAPHPHCLWPPAAPAEVLAAIGQQRNTDISIRGRSGPIAAFEDAFLAFLDHQVPHAVTFNSGTSALLAAYFAAGIGAGDEVIGPCLTYHAALSPLFMLRARPVLVDIDLHTRCIDPELIESRITSRTRAITVVHQWGHPAPMDEILAIARKHRLLVIEDCSHAHGSRYRGQLCGTFGDVAAFSLQANKAIYAGEGGILVTRNPEIHDRAVLLGHYRDRSRDSLLSDELRKFWVTGFGLKLRMSPFNAIVAHHALRSFPAIKEGRRRCLGYFLSRLEEFPFITPPSIASDVDMGAWYGFKPLYRQEALGGLPRNKFIEALQAEGLDVDAPSGGMLAPMPLYASAVDPMFGYERTGAPNDGEFPVASRVEEEGLSLPTFYDWDKHKPVIDQYVDGLGKVAAWRASSHARRGKSAEELAPCGID